MSVGQAIAERPAETGGVALSPERIEAFLRDLEEKGRTEETIRTYRRSLNKICRLLPEGERIRRGTLERIQRALLEDGYTPGTVNSYLAAANTYLEHHGHRELQIDSRLKGESAVQPELERREYLRLLSTAKALEREKPYLLIKVFGVLGLNLLDLPLLTAEAVAAGRVSAAGVERRIPACLQAELVDYIQREGVLSGPVFITRSGRPMNRSHVTAAIQTLCRDARVDPEKATPRCLRKLCQSTRDGIWEDISILVERSYDRMLEREQQLVGWESHGGKGVSAL
ncbi:site-specific integrase [Pseudoflavonifractor sp. MSJ-37]|uniref:site-specific integrase n=1 Tax=Pseudoflavonifractor sp. MSJ-37 TaxID=2841531 RepID=UPI001C0FC7DC|nr:site-specific integrase [Pseudoflavonifractor sp. MSJ-37]MBU5434962.1 site-specific integrase [Pseudoflavonifractor sp. MSJ-37]